MRFQEPYGSGAPKKLDKNISSFRTEGSRTPYFYLYILASIVYSIYTYMWDIKVLYSSSCSEFTAGISYSHGFAIWTSRYSSSCTEFTAEILFSWICNFWIYWILLGYVENPKLFCSGPGREPMTWYPEVEFLDVIGTKVLRVFLLAEVVWNRFVM